MQSRVVTIVVLHIFPEAAAVVECLPLSAMVAAVVVAAVMTSSNATITAACTLAWKVYRYTITMPPTRNCNSCEVQHMSMRAHQYCCWGWDRRQGSD